MKNILSIIATLVIANSSYGQSTLNRIVAGFPVNYNDDSVGILLRNAQAF